MWNDAWMARRDLKDSGYTGWQAIGKKDHSQYALNLLSLQDATPQERSDKKYQLGPVPVSAVKNGETGVKYDLEFVYSEVNADEKYVHIPNSKEDCTCPTTFTNMIVDTTLLMGTADTSL